MAMAKSQRELAIALGKSQPAINKWLKHPRWPFSKTGPWDVEAVRAWAAKTLGLNPGAGSVPTPQPQPAPPSPTKTTAPAMPEGIESLDVKLRTDLYLKVQRASAIKFENEQEQGKYILRSQVEQERLARIHAVRAAHQQLVRVSPRLVGMNETEIAACLEAEVVKICHAFSRDPESEGAA